MKERVLTAEHGARILPTLRQADCVQSIHNPVPCTSSVKLNMCNFNKAFTIHFPSSQLCVIYASRIALLPTHYASNRLCVILPF